MVENLEIKKILVSESEIDYKIFADIKEHCSRVTKLSMLIGKKLELRDNELETLKNSALLHDYGKYYIPRNILLKPSKLTIGEMRVMKKHAYYGSKFAASKHYKKDISTCILYHHENYDGTGYYGVKGDFIPLCSRIIRIADVYDALTSDRPYRKALNINETLEVLDSEKKNFDRNIYELFIKKTVVNL